MAIIHQILAGSFPAAGGGASGTTWDPSGKHADITLTNSNLTATRTGGTGDYRNVRSITGKSSGKYYVECSNFTWVTADYNGIGLADVAFDVVNSTSWVGNFQNTVALYLNNSASYVYMNAGSILTASGHTSGQSIDMSIDLDTMTLGFRINNGSWEDASIGALTGTSWHFAASLRDGSSGSAATIVTNSGDWVRTPRSGFSQWT